MNATPRAVSASLRALRHAHPPASVPFTLAPLPYPDDALEPVISSNTLRLHHGRHHQGYVDTLNSLVAGTPLAELSLQQLMLSTANSPQHSSILHAAALAWNHSFYWRSLCPAARAVPHVLLQAIDASFGSFELFRSRFISAAAGALGSGWVWLVLDGGKLKIVLTSNADNPLTYQMRPLLTLDLWEHAFYPDYQDRRADYVRFAFDRLLNWEFADENFCS
jgi:superoxide dismutase, Fe-Mn family